MKSSRLRASFCEKGEILYNDGLYSLYVSVGTILPKNSKLLGSLEFSILLEDLAQ